MQKFFNQKDGTETAIDTLVAAAQLYNDSKYRSQAGPQSAALHLAQAQSNRGRRGRKKDFPDAERSEPTPQASSASPIFCAAISCLSSGIAEAYGVDPSAETTE